MMWAIFAALLVASAGNALAFVWLARKVDSAHAEQPKQLPPMRRRLLASHSLALTDEHTAHRLEPGTHRIVAVNDPVHLHVGDNTTTILQKQPFELDVDECCDATMCASPGRRTGVEITRLG